uniref:Pyroglutamyl-peptidase I n=1 Tax=Branchiostoma floridae TaxID=7739 RepID=C3YQ14_BRAFL|eukprot:XP_002601640.1 hypothetical protein BRAFLDRAFT_124319 [Branchiostoma floridae]
MLPIVFVTGFGPFGDHEVNASWVSVQEMAKLGLGEDVDLRVEELPVEYKAVKQTVPTIWKKYKPKLMVHVGVSGLARNITLEQVAHNSGYERLDVQCKCPDSKCCVDDGDDTLVSLLDMEDICTRVNQTETEGTPVVASYDAGRYLCDFSYYTSLHCGSRNAAFIHVPPLDKPFSAQVLGSALREIILTMLKFLKEKKEEGTAGLSLQNHC